MVRRLGRRGLFVFAAIAATGLALALAGARAATIQTDLWAYQVGDTVTVTGSGFAPGETVGFTAFDTFGAVVDMGQAPADSAGNVEYKFVLRSDVPGIYTEEATGQTSGLTATTTFDPTNPPGTPGTLSFTDARWAADGISLKWSAATSGTAPDCYYVYRTQSTSLTTAPPTPTEVTTTTVCSGSISGVYAIVSNAPTATTTFTDNAGDQSHNYAYAISGVKASGTNAGQSALTNVVTTGILNSSVPATFPITAVGSTAAAQTITVTNNSGTAIVYHGIETTAEFPVSNVKRSDNTLMVPDTTGLAVGQSFSFNVAFAPSAAGARSATLKVEGFVNGSQTSATFDTHSITVAGTGDSPPTCSAVSRSLNEDASVPVSISCTDPDAGDTFTYAVNQPAHGTLTGTAPNLTYTPAANYNGSDSFTYTATDNHGATSTAATGSLTVVPVNDPPTATAGTASTNEDTAKTVDLTALASDLETKPSSALTYSLVAGAANGVVSVTSGGTATYTPSANFHGTDTFTYKVTDTGDPAGCTTASSTCDPTKLSATATVTVTVVPVDDAPTANNGSATTNEDTAKAIDLSTLASDIETPSANLTYAITSSPTNGSTSLGTGGSVTYTPGANFHGTDSFTYKVTDNGDPAGCTTASATCDPTAKTSATATVSITVNPVNDTPTATLASALTNEDTAASIDLKPSVSDVETAPAAMTYAVTPPLHGSVAPGATNGTFVYTPAANYNGPDSFTYTATDTGDPTGCTGAPPACSAPLTSAPQTVSVTVLPVNDAPVASPGTGTAAEDTPTAIDLTPFASDVETPRANLTYAIVSGPTHGTASVGSGGIVNYTSAPNYHGPDSFTYRVTDTGDPVGSSNVLSSGTATISLTVNPVNDAPVATGASASSAEDTAATVDLTSHASDVETAASAMTYTVVDPPGHGSVAPGATNGTFVYTPAPNYNGADSFTYTVTDTGDPAGCTGPAPGCSAPLTSAKQTVTLTVTPVNDAPVATDGSASTNEDTQGTVDLTQFAHDVETPSAGLTYAIVGGPAHGSVALGAGGSVTYTPDSNFNGSDTFTYDVTDTGDPAGSPNVLTSATKTISLTVNPVNDRPSAGFASALTNEDTAKTIDLRGSVSDVETAPGAMAYAISAPPGHGTVTSGATNGTFVYTPAPNYNGSDTFAYTVTDTGDPAGCTGSAPSCSAPLTSVPNTVTLTVLPVNDAPVAHDYTVGVGTAAGTTFDLSSAAGVVSDAETANANLTYTIVTGPTQGTLSAGGTPGAFTYVPKGTATGTDTATYAVTDRGDPDACGAPSASCDGAKTSATYTITFAIASTIAPPVTDGLQLEFDGDSVAQADGSSVSQWRDGSGNGRDLSAAPGAAATLHAGAVNGHAAVEFDGVNSLLKTYGSTFTIAQPDTFYIVYRSADPASDTSRGFVFDSTDSSLRQAFGREDSQTQRMYANIDLDAANVTYPFAGYEIWSGTFNGTNSPMFENGTQVANGNTGGASLAGFTVGGLNSGSTFGFDRGHSYIAELLVYSGAQTDAQRTTITNWLNGKFNAIGSPTPPANTTAPSLDGYPLSGATLTAAKGVWTGTVPIHYAYEIRRCDSAGNNCVAVANTQDYTLTPADEGSTIRAAVTATNSAGSSTAVSAPTAVITRPVLLANDAPPYTQGLQLWYDARDESYIDGAKVTTFHDLSGYGRDLTNAFADGADAPTFRAGAVGGLPAVEFDGIRSLLKTYGSKFAFKQPDSFFIVYKQLDDSHEAYVFDSMDSSSRQLLGRSPAGDMEMYANNELHAPATFPFPRFQVWSGTFSDGSSLLDENGTQAAAGNTGTAPLNGFTLGGLNSGGSSGYNLSHSLVAEVLWYSGSLTSSQRQSIEQWLLNKYGLGKPTATLTAPATAVQGNAVTVSLDNAQTSSSDPLHYAFACDGASLAGVTYATAGTSSSTTCTYTTTVTHTIVARVIDSQDQFTEYSQTIAATQSSPSATFAAPSSVGEGTAIHLSLGNPTDTSTAGAPFTYAFDCGSGTFGVFSSANATDCPTTDNGSAVVRAEIKDAFGNTATYPATVTITNVAPTVSAPAAQSSSEGAAALLSLGSFTDPGANDGPWHVTVNWADGSTAAFDNAATGSLGLLTHIYVDSGTYTVAVTVTDKDGGTGSASFAVTVADVAPTATLGNNSPVSQGSPATISFTSQSDPSPADTAAGFTYRYACDGSTFGAATSSASATCTFVDVGSHVVKARIADRDGAYSELTTSVSVTNVAPTVTAAASQSANEGASTSFSIGSFTDPGTNDGPWHATVAWGDGGSTSFDSTSGSLAAHAHTYVDSGSYTVTVSVADKNGGSGSSSFTVTVANVAPSVSAPADQSSNEGSASMFALGSFTDPGTADGPWQVHVVWGDGSSDNFPASAPGSLGLLTHTYADNATYHASVTVTDKHTAAGTASFSVSVANVAPTATLSNAGPVGEGSPVAITFSSQSDPSSVDTANGFKYSFACDGSNYGAATTSATAQCTFADQGTYTVAAKIADKDGGFTAYTTAVTVTNVAPTATFAATSPIDEGSSATLSFTQVFDPSSADTAVGFTYAFACDGLHFGTAGGSTTTTCAFPTPGTYTVAGTVTDKDGGSTSYNAQVVVRNVAPTVTAAAAQTANEGSSTSFNLGSFTDPGVNDGPWSVSVNWGDGSPTTTFSSTPGTLPAQPHTYAAPGNFTATVTVTERSGASGSGSFAVAVADVAPSVTAPADQTATEAAAKSFALGSFTDPGTQDGPWTATVAWGDGSSTSFSAATPTTLAAQTHTYVAPGTYSATISVTDHPAAGGSLTGSATFKVVVGDVAPTVTAPANQSANEGASTSFNLGSFSDPGTADNPWGVSVHWGDGTADTVLSAGAPGSLGSAPHTYATPGTYHPTVTVTDKPGASGSATFTVTVNNVAPTVTAPANQTASEGTSQSFSLGSFSDPGVNDSLWTADVNWGDATAHGGFTTSSQGSLGSLSHIYGSAGTYTVTVKVTDNGSLYDSKTFIVAVANVAPAVSITGAPTTSTGEGTALVLGSSVIDPGLADTFTYAWSVTKDGAAYISGSGSTLNLTPNDNGTYVATLTVTDKNGGTGTDSKTITVTNVAPTATISGAVTINEGSSATVTLSTPTDPSTADVAAGLRYVFNCNGPITSFAYAAGTTTPSASCPYDDGPSDHTVNAAVIDKDGGYTSYTAAVHVNDVLPTATFNTPFSISEGGAFSLSLTNPTDPSAADSAHFQYAFDCGAGYQPTSDFATATCPGTASGSVTLHGKIFDKDGFTPYSQTVSVSNVAPTPSITDAPASSPEGTTILLHSSATDPGNDISTYTWTVKKNGVAFGNTGTSAAYSFTPDDNGSYVVTLAVADTNGGSTTTSATIAVSNVNPVPSITSAPASGAEGTPITVTGSSTDAGPADAAAGLTQSWSVTRGGTTGAVASGTGSSVTFTPGFHDTYVVTLTTTDKDGGSGTAQASIPVSNVAPSPAITGAPTTSPEGTAIALGSTTGDPGAGIGDTFTYGWSVTKNGSTFATGSASSFTLTPDDNGSYVVSLNVTDADGATVAAAQKTVTVTNVAPTAASVSNSGPITEGSSATITVVGAADASPIDAASLHFAFSCDGPLAVPAYSAAATSSSTTCSYNDGPSVHTVTAAVIDKEGASTTYTTTVQVNNVAPTASLSNNGPVNEGSTATITFSSAADASPVDAASLHFAYACDGSLTVPAYSATSASATATCTYSDGPATHTVTGAVIDKDGGYTTYTTTVQVNNVAPTATFTASSPVNEGSAVSLALTAPSDPSSVDTAAGFTYAFDCGDGSGYGAFAAASSASCPTTDNGSRTVKGEIRDKDGGITEYTQAVTIANVAPTGTISSSWNGVANQALSIYFTAATDVSSADVSAGLRYAFGCTGPVASPTYAGASTTSSTTCTYATGDYTAHAYVIDKDGGFTDYPLAVHIVNPPPTVTFSSSNTTSINEGATATTQYTYSYTTANATSVGTPSCGSLGALVAGTATWASSTGAGSFKCTFNTADGTATSVSNVSITATGSAGSTTGTQNVQIANVAPTVTITSPLNFTSYLVGSPVNFVATFKDAGTGDGPWTCQWNFGNGVTRNVTPAGTAQPYSCNTSYQYPAKGTFTATLTVTDKDGGVGQKTVSVIVS